MLKRSGSVHTFHIPVMGTGFSIDTPLRVAKYGISSVVSLVDDVLIEQMRKFHSEREGEPYEEIADRDEDARARRITAYLNLLGRLVDRQVRALQESPFEPGSEITRYYEMLPETKLKRDYVEMLAVSDPAAKARMQEELRHQAVPGSIDVNIMTKLDRDAYRGGKKLQPEYADAMAALRGFAESDLESSVVLSAGMNPRLFGYMAQFEDFLPDGEGVLRKRIILKVSDYRSAMVQGRFLAKRALWVSEHRIESGLNCGGHAFPSAGQLLGPVLEKFKEERAELVDRLHGVYAGALATAGRPCVAKPHEVRITVQGGIGTAGEKEFLLERFGLNGTGWATPFLLVPEVTNVDDELLEKLSAATEQDVFLSECSPLNIPYWDLRTSASEEARVRRIGEGRPGSPCPKEYLALDRALTEVPICVASRGYVKRKLKMLAEEGAPEEEIAPLIERVLGKSCVCHDLAGCVTLKHGIDPKATPAACPGLGIADFSKVAALEEMISHIYGGPPLPMSSDRPHMFIRELTINVEFLRAEIERARLGLLSRAPDYFNGFRTGLLDGIEYYRELSVEFSAEERDGFLKDLDALHQAVESIPVALPSSAVAGPTS